MQLEVQLKMLVVRWKDGWVRFQNWNLRGKKRCRKTTSMSSLRINSTMYWNSICHWSEYRTVLTICVWNPDLLPRNTCFPRKQSARKHRRAERRPLRTPATERCCTANGFHATLAPLIHLASLFCWNNKSVQSGKRVVVVVVWGSGGVSVCTAAPLSIT